MTFGFNSRFYLTLSFWGGIFFTVVNFPPRSWLGWIGLAVALLMIGEGLFRRPNIISHSPIHSSTTDKSVSDK